MFKLVATENEDIFEIRGSVYEKNLTDVAQSTHFKFFLLGLLRESREYCGYNPETGVYRKKWFMTAEHQNFAKIDHIAKYSLRINLANSQIDNETAAEIFSSIAAAGIEHKIVSIDLSENQLSEILEIDLSKFTRLSRLNLSKNPFISVPVINNKPVITCVDPMDLEWEQMETVVLENSAGPNLNSVSRCVLS